jgi:3-oxoacyl-[acyl-carrier protein] reductase
MIDLKGKRALVTGGSRGIGAATALLLAECGADVGIGYRNREKDAQDIVRRISAFGVRGFAHASDLSTPSGTELLFARAKRELGGLDLFVGNAGIWPFEDVPVGQMSDDRWHTTMRANMDSMFTTTRAAVRTISDHGRIVLVSSTAGQRGEAGHSDYAASRGAMISFVKSVAVELAPRDVTVNSVAPGWVDTEMAAQSLEGDGRAKVERTIPLGRVAAAKDIAGPIVFLCSDYARHITGEVLNVNGGSVLCG